MQKVHQVFVKQLIVSVRKVMLPFFRTCPLDQNRNCSTRTCINLSWTVAVMNLIVKEKMNQTVKAKAMRKVVTQMWVWRHQRGTE